MIFSGEKSGLARLSDTVKDGLDLCAEKTEAFLQVLGSYGPLFARVQSLSAQALEQGAHSYDGIEAEIQATLAQVPPDVSLRLPLLQARLHSYSLTTVLSCCFTLESYINALAFYLISEKDLLGLIRTDRKSTAELLLEAIDKLQAREKWKKIGQLTARHSFDTGRSPYQDFDYLFRFRDDHVHDKVVDLSDRAKKRYNNNFPDPVFGLLDLGHALYAADTYWGMVLEVHRLLGVPPEDFHRHYNLTPWQSDDEQARLKRLVARYRNPAVAS